jgi:aryl-alcohol dehydrogenase-like predicted oxidoreductase
MESVDTVVIGVKNREELAECVAAEAAGRLSPDEMQEVERSAGRSV